MPVRKTLLYFALLLIACFSMGDTAVPIVDSNIEVQEEAWGGSGEPSDTFDPELEAGFADFGHQPDLLRNPSLVALPAIPAYLSQHASPRPIRAPPAIA